MRQYGGTQAHLLAGRNYSRAADSHVWIWKQVGTAVDACQTMCSLDVSMKYAASIFRAALPQPKRPKIKCGELLNNQLLIYVQITTRRTLKRVLLKYNSPWSDYWKILCLNCWVLIECHLFTYWLTPWCRVLLEQLTGLQIVKKFPAFHGTRRFITVLTSVRHLSLSWANPI